MKCMVLLRFAEKVHAVSETVVCGGYSRLNQQSPPSLVVSLIFNVIRYKSFLFSYNFETFPQTMK